MKRHSLAGLLNPTLAQREDAVREALGWREEREPRWIDFRLILDVATRLIESIAGGFPFLAAIP